jgi:hypothetical protein
MKVMKATIAMPSPPFSSDGSPQRNPRGLTWEPVMLTVLRERMATMRMWMCMRRKNHCHSMMDLHRMWRAVLGPSEVNRYEGEYGDDADADEEEEAVQANDGSTQNVED